MFQPARPVHSDQSECHPGLAAAVIRHLQSPSRRPCAEHTRQAFAGIDKLVRTHGGPVVLDSGCGTGESTGHLARRFPHCLVIGIDKSALRLGKSQQHDTPANAIHVRAELQDFWALAAQARWNIVYHALYYPNPWPKAHHLFRRFHAHPVFPILLQLAPELELRTNWRIYAEEFAAACVLANVDKCQLTCYTPFQPETAFERKYQEAGQDLWQIRVTLKDYLSKL